MLALIDSLSLAMSKPRTRPSPLVGVMMPHNMRMVVVLPEPFGPRKANTSPSRTSNDRRSTAVSSPYTLVRSCALTAVVISVQRLPEPVRAEAEDDHAERGEREHFGPDDL